MGRTDFSLGVSGGGRLYPLMELPALALLSILVLLCYLFEVSSARTRIPSVLLLLGLGMALRPVCATLGWSLPGLARLLPEIGTAGLILIVLEGALELRFSRARAPLIWRSLFLAAVTMALLAVGLAYALTALVGCDFRTGLLNALPFSVISSAVAVPTSRLLGAEDAEFIIYESAFSDILGVLAFNFFLANEVIGSAAVKSFFLQLSWSALLAFGGTMLLAFLISRLRHRVKFGPILALVILLYSVAKHYHLPALLLILVLGLFLANFRKLDRFPRLAFLRPDSLEPEVRRFDEILGELTFVVRIAFFLLFGFLIDFTQLFRTDVLLWAGGTLLAAYALRAGLLRLAGQRLAPVGFVAPRGLITVLLLLQLPPAVRLARVDDALVTQVVIFSALVMMAGTAGAARRTTADSAGHEPA